MTGSLQVEETSAYCTVNHCASISNYQLTYRCPVVYSAVCTGFLHLQTKPSIVCWDLTACGSLFRSAGATTTKIHLPMCFEGWVGETDSLLPRVRLLDLIKGERYRSCERLIALNTRMFYLKRIQC